MSSLSISSNAHHHSPRADMDQRIASAVSSGSVSTEDANAFSTALDSIDATLSDSASTSSSRLSPSDMKSRMDSLIEEQVSNGTLTEDQASELQALFAQGPGGASGKGASDGSSSDGSDTSSSDSSTSTIDALGAWGASGMQGPMGPPPPPPPSDSDGDGDDSVSGTSSTSASSSTSAAKEMAALLEALKKLRIGMANSSGTYSVSDSSTATGTSTSSTSGLIVDQTA